ncbi:PRC-barrel domain-containing protein [Cyanobacteria bacterium FACHB-63]|nr:PRC-barrel domain-containing protein [Cyanobacteria bacterium FACHB-63]
MPLYKIRDFDPEYQRYFDDRDILKFDVYSGHEKVGTVNDLLVDESGRFRYLVINIGKRVLVPISRSRIDDAAGRVYIDGLTHDQVQRLPEYTGEPVDYDYEERVRSIYRPLTYRDAATAPVAYDRKSYHYDRDPALYHLNDRDHSSLRRSEARLMASKPIVGKHRRAIGVFPNRQAAEQALHELRDSGFPMGRVSVVTRDANQPHEIAGADVHHRIGNKAEEVAAIGAVSGGALGGLTGFLVGLGTLAIPGVGPIMLAGATATTLATTLAGGAIGIVSGGLLGALVGLGIPEERARIYEERIVRGGYLVIVDGTDADIARAQVILHNRGIEDYGIYDAPTATPAPSASTIHPSRTTSERLLAIGLFPHLADTESAIADLRSIGFPLSQISLVAHNLQRRERFAGVDVRDRFEAASLGIPAEQSRFYHDRLRRGRSLVIVHGTEDELNRATPILSRHGIQEYRIYNPNVVYYESPLEAPRAPKRVIAVPLTSTASEFRGDRPQVDQLPYAVGFFLNRREAEQAIADLREAGLPSRQISLVAQRFDHREAFTGVELRDRFDNRRFGFPEERVHSLNNRIAQGHYLVILRGTSDQLRQAEAVLKRPRIHDFGIYDMPSIAHDRTQPELTHHRVVPAAVPPTVSTTSSHSGGVETVRKRAIGVFSHRRDAEAALTALRDAGFPMEQVFLTSRQVNNARILGISEERARVYTDRLTQGDELIIIDGTEAEARQAESILRHYNIQQWGIYDTADVRSIDQVERSSPHQIAPDADLPHPEPRIDRSHPYLTIIDRRGETQH